MKTIVSAGMHRSGSTWLFNVLRHIHIEKKIDFYSCFVPVNKRKLKDTNIIKIHSFNKYLAVTGNYVLLTKRDIRDIAASAIRRNLVAPFKSNLKSYLKRVVEWEYIKWKPYIDLEIRYEDIIQDKVSHIMKVAKFIEEEVDENQAKAIKETVDSIAKNVRKFNPATQIHPGHITDGGTNVFINTLGVGLTEMIQHEFGEYCYG